MVWGGQHRFVALEQQPAAMRRRASSYSRPARPRGLGENAMRFFSRRLSGSSGRPIASYMVAQFLCGPELGQQRQQGGPLLL